jgi:hypothetical protein
MKKPGASRSRRREELRKAASLLQETRPDLAGQLRDQAKFLSGHGLSGPLAEFAHLPGFHEQQRAKGRDELVEAGKALVESRPAMAHLLYIQAAALTSSPMLRGKLAAMATNARRRAEQARASARRGVGSSRQPSSSSEEGCADT